MFIEVNIFPLEPCTPTSTPQVEEQAKNKGLPAPGEVMSAKLGVAAVERYTAPEEVLATTVRPSAEQTMLVYQLILKPYAMKLEPLSVLTYIAPEV